MGYDKAEDGYRKILEETTYTPAAMARREQEVRRGFWSKIKRFAARVPFMEDLVAAYYCALDPKTPIRVRGMLLAALAYFIMPLDVVPDFILGLGFTDDAAVIAIVMSLVSRNISDVHREAARNALDKEGDTHESKN